MSGESRGRVRGLCLYFTCREGLAARRTAQNNPLFSLSLTATRDGRIQVSVQVASNAPSRLLTTLPRQAYGDSVLFERKDARWWRIFSCSPPNRSFSSSPTSTGKPPAKKTASSKRRHSKPETQFETGTTHWPI